MRNIKVPWFAALPILLTVAGSFYAFDRREADARDHAAVRGKVWTNEECLHCHTDEETLHKMQSKRGDPTYCQAAFIRLTKAATSGKPAPGAESYK